MKAPATPSLPTPPSFPGNMSLNPSEPILCPSKKRRAIFPIQYPRTWERYRKARALFWALGPPGAPKGGGEASRAFLRGVAFTYVSFSPIRGLATPFKPNLPFGGIWTPHNWLLAEMNCVDTTQNCVVATQHCVVATQNCVVATQHSLVWIPHRERVGRYRGLQRASTGRGPWGPGPLWGPGPRIYWFFGPFGGP